MDIHNQSMILKLHPIKLVQSFYAIKEQLPSVDSYVITLL